MPKKRAAFYFDGCNLYHALDALRQRHLKWLSLHDLGNLLIPSRDEELRSVVHFSAYLTHKPDKLVRHRSYVAALEATGVECVLGRFKYSDVRCRNCGSQWRSYEEKETDVNIGIRIVRDAFRDVFDVYYLVSADTDLAPAIRLLKKEFPQKEFVSVATPRRPHSSEFLRLADRTIKITENALAKCLLPARIAGKEGKVIVRPAQYDLPVDAGR
jgi:uncharacterized LabA/DUF88 family protein